MGVSEQAVSAGRSITQGTLEEVGAMLDQLGETATLRDLMRERPRPIIDALTRDGVITARERPQFVESSTGALSEQGKNFVERALLGSVIDDVRLMENAPRSILNKVDRSLADLSRLKARKDEWDITPLLRRALDEHTAITARGMSVEDYLGQVSMFGPERNPVSDALVRALALRPNEVRQALRQFSSDAKADVSGQPTLGLFEVPEAWKSFNEAFKSKLKEGEYLNGLERAIREEMSERPRAEAADQGITPRPGEPSRGRPGETQPVRPAGRTGEAERITPPEAESAPPLDLTELSANPVFNPRFWNKANEVLRPAMQKIENSISRAFGKLPFSLRKWFQEDPQLKRIFHEARAEVGARRLESDAVLRMVLKEKPTPVG